MEALLKKKHILQHLSGAIIGSDSIRKTKDGKIKILDPFAIIYLPPKLKSAFQIRLGKRIAEIKV